MTKKRDAEFRAIYDEAYAAGRAAGIGVTPTPMIVGSPSTPFGNDVDPNQKVYHVPEGVCGFAWVNVSPGNSPFANWLKKNNLARKSYYGGVDIWVSDYNQSMTRKECHASAFAKILRNHGIKADSMSRMD